MNPEDELRLKNVLHGMVKDSKWKERLDEAKLRQVWSAKMGTTINHHTVKINLRKNKLIIEINAAALKQELSFEKEKIKEMINRELGDEVVKEVIIL
jgi:hypothetical protein